MLTGLNVGGKTRNIAFHLVLQQCCKTSWMFLFPVQRAKKVMSDSPGLVDFAIGLVNSVFNLPDGQVIFFEQFE